ncbi:MAG: LysR family transcriptional regulator [Burkholderiales bacterium]|nr:LysR family transcriptional regulator [Burkholderiales bacterium]
MDKFHAMRAFVRIVDAGSITAAAQALDVSQPAMVRTLAALEKELGVRLLNRTTRRMSLTDAGRDYCERSRQILAAVEEADLALSSRLAAPRGRLRVASSVSFGRSVVAPVVTEYLALHPAVQVELLLLDRVVDLIEEGMDVAVRLARLADSSLVAHPLGYVRRVTVASPALLRREGVPRTVADLRGRRCVSFAGLTAPSRWIYGEGRGAMQVAIADAFVTNQVDAAIAACLEGVGIGRFLDYQVADALRSGKLKRILSDSEGDPIPVSIVHPSARLQSANLRSFIAHARPRIGARLAGMLVR